MLDEDNTNILHGPDPVQDLPNVSIGTLMYNNLISNTYSYAALIDAHTERQMSYQELLGRSCTLASALEKSGYGKNTILSISSENTIEFFIPVLACLYIGGTLAPINHNYTVDELDHTINITKPKLMFCSKKVYRKFVNFNKKSNIFHKIIIIDDDNDGVDAISLRNFCQKVLTHDNLIYRFLPVKVDVEEDVAFIMCSSGTTGLPKGVMLTHKNISVRFAHSLDPRYVLPTTDDNNRILGILPCFHGYGLITNLVAIWMGQQIIYINRFEEILFLRTIEKYRITRLWLAPPLVLFLAKTPLLKDYDLTCIKEIACGAAPLDKNTEETLKKKLNVKQIRQGYGLTEATLAVIMMPVNVEKFGSCGQLMSYMSCKIRDPETRKSMGPYQVGELCLKGPFVMKGYYNNYKATTETFTSDGWLKTGDLGYYDDNGFFFIVDRLKELIKYKGFQVAPAELEALLVKHPNIRDAAVVGLPNDEAGELPIAFIIKSPNCDITEKEIEDYVAKKVSSQKRLRGGVVFVGTIPKNPSGKILRRELRNSLKKIKQKY